MVRQLIAFWLQPRRVQKTTTPRGLFCLGWRAGRTGCPVSVPDHINARQPHSKPLRFTFNAALASSWSMAPVTHHQHKSPIAATPTAAESQLPAARWPVPDSKSRTPVGSAPVTTAVPSMSVVPAAEPGVAKVSTPQATLVPVNVLVHTVRVGPLTEPSWKLGPSEDEPVQVAAVWASRLQRKSAVLPVPSVGWRQVNSVRLANLHFIRRCARVLERGRTLSEHEREVPGDLTPWGHVGAKDGICRC